MVTIPLLDSFLKIPQTWHPRFSHCLAASGGMARHWATCLRIAWRKQETASETLMTHIPDSAHLRKAGGGVMQALHVCVCVCGEARRGNPRTIGSRRRNAPANMECVPLQSS